MLLDLSWTAQNPCTCVRIDHHKCFITDQQATNLIILSYSMIRKRDVTENTHDGCSEPHCKFELHSSRKFDSKSPDVNHASRSVNYAFVNWNWIHKWMWRYTSLLLAYNQRESKPLLCTSPTVQIHLSEASGSSLHPAYEGNTALADVHQNCTDVSPSKCPASETIIKPVPHTPQWCEWNFCNLVLYISEYAWYEACVYKVLVIWKPCMFTLNLLYE